MRDLNVPSYLNLRRLEKAGELPCRLVLRDGIDFDAPFHRVDRECDGGDRGDCQAPGFG
jgi:hypothetical protein